MTLMGSYLTVLEKKTEMFWDFHSNTPFPDSEDHHSTPFHKVDLPASMSDHMLFG